MDVPAKVTIRIEVHEVYMDEDAHGGVYLLVGFTQLASAAAHF